MKTENNKKTRSSLVFTTALCLSMGTLVGHQAFAMETPNDDNTERRHLWIVPYNYEEPSDHPSSPSGSSSSSSEEKSNSSSEEEWINDDPDVKNAKKRNKISKIENKIKKLELDIENEKINKKADFLFKAVKYVQEVEAEAAEQVRKNEEHINNMMSENNRRVNELTISLINIASKNEENRKIHYVSEFKAQEIHYINMKKKFDNLPHILKTHVRCSGNRYGSSKVYEMKPFEEIKVDVDLHKFIETYASLNTYLQEILKSYRTNK